MFLQFFFTPLNYETMFEQIAFPFGGGEKTSSKTDSDITNLLIVVSTSAIIFLVIKYYADKKTYELKNDKP